MSSSKACSPARFIDLPACWAASRISGECRMQNWPMKMTVRVMKKGVKTLAEPEPAPKAVVKKVKREGRKEERFSNESMCRL